jgi:signal transduction histidine kinase/CheY-like chemotaxis protein
VVALQGPGDKVIRATNVIDISDRKQIEDERSRLLASESAARAQAEQASRAKDEFLAMLGHELRNPLSPIVTAMELIKLRSGPGERGREYAVIERQVRHLVRLVDDLLDVSRVTRGKIALDRKPIEIADIVEQAVEVVSPLLERHKHELHLDVPRTDLRVLGDRGRLAQAVTNLLTNAAKYTPEPGHIAVTAGRDGDDVQVRVTDDGVGLAPDLLPLVFEPFVQGPRSPERAEGGLGIGLALVKSLVHLHGGSVWAGSEGPGRGSEFVIRLPLLVPEQAQPPAPASAAVRAGPPPASRHVLVVDDNRDAAEVTAEILREVGYEVTLAFDPAQALSSLEDATPEVAILDVGLPVMDGYELARQIRQRVSGTTPRFIALSGYGQDGDRARSASAGFECHLVKPVDFDALVEAIERHAGP